MNASSVLAWKEALSRLSDKHFFHLMRLYLGQIKTPFNKQGLVDSLAAFLRNPDVRKNMLACLDGFDLRLISGVFFLSEPDRMKLARLFASEYPFSDVYNRILNLEERLLIFRMGEDSTAGYRVNPYLEDELRARAGFSLLVSPVAADGGGSRGDSASAATGRFAPLPGSDLTAAGVFCFFLQNKPAEKVDRGLKKKDAERFSLVFPDFPCSAETLVAALRKLSLLQTREGRLCPENSVWEKFASLSVRERTLWLCAAGSAQGAVASVIASKAAVFSRMLSIVSAGEKYRRADLERLLFVLQDTAAQFPVAAAGSPVKNTSGQSRFASIIAESRASSSALSELDAAVAFGLLVADGGCFSVNSALFSEVEAPPRFVFVSPSFEVTALQGGKLGQLLPLMRFVEPEHIQSAGVFRISRRACSSAFASGETDKSAAAVFSSLGVGVPENVGFSLGDWFASFSSARLYSGFILKVEKRVRPFFAEGGNLHGLVRLELAPGVYLLSARTKAEIESAMRAEGLDFLSFDSGEAVRHASEDVDHAKTQGGRPAGNRPVFLAELPPQECPSGFFAGGADVREADGDAERGAEYSALKKSLMDRLAEMDVPDSVRNVFESRIENKTIVCESQLDPSAVRFEKNEAKALDFSGKLRLVEQACKTGAVLEIVTDEKSKANPETYIVKPESAGDGGGTIRRKGGPPARGVVLFGTIEPSGEPCVFSIARASSIRILPSRPM